jgi:hypothetical protein
MEIQAPTLPNMEIQSYHLETKGPTPPRQHHQPFTQNRPLRNRELDSYHHHQPSIEMEMEAQTLPNMEIHSYHLETKGPTPPRQRHAIYTKLTLRDQLLRNRGVHLYHTGVTEAPWTNSGYKEPLLQHIRRPNLCNSPYCILSGKKQAEKGSCNGLTGWKYFKALRKMGCLFLPFPRFLLRSLV